MSARTYVVSYQDETGAIQQVEADSLAGLATELEEAGYTGSTLRVVDEAGFTVGWVSAGEYRAA